MLSNILFLVNQCPTNFSSYWGMVIEKWKDLRFTGDVGLTNTIHVQLLKCL